MYPFLSLKIKYKITVKTIQKLPGLSCIFFHSLKESFFHLFYYFWKYLVTIWQTNATKSVAQSVTSAGKVPSWKTALRYQTGRYLDILRRVKTQWGWKRKFAHLIIPLLTVKNQGYETQSEGRFPQNCSLFQSCRDG